MLTNNIKIVVLAKLLSIIFEQKKKILNSKV